MLHAHAPTHRVSLLTQLRRAFRQCSNAFNLQGSHARDSMFEVLGARLMNCGAEPFPPS